MIVVLQNNQRASTWGRLSLRSQTWIRQMPDILMQVFFGVKGTVLIYIQSHLVSHTFKYVFPCESFLRQ